MRQIIFDIETDGLLDEVSKIWCICLRIIDDGVEGPTYSYVNDGVTDDLDDAIGLLEEADMLIGQNILGYDLLVIEKLYTDFDPKPEQLIRDTLVMSQMYFANEKDRDYDRFRRGMIQGKDIGRHGLEAWGQRLGHYKGDYAKEMKAKGKDPWKEFEFETGVPYCEDDIEVNSRLWRKILNMEWSEESIILEHQITQLMVLQEHYGFWFDRDKAKLLGKELSITYDKLRESAVAHFGNWWAPAKKYKEAPREQFGEDSSRQIWGEVSIEKRESRKVRIKEGAPNAGVLCHFSADAPYCKVELKEFNPNSRPQIIDRLKFVYGWEPVDFTEAGTPEVNDEVLRGLAEHWEICDTLAELFFYSKLLGMLSNGDNAWLTHADDDGFIHGRCNAGGTRSGRASHSSPNIAQIPKVKSISVRDKDGNYAPVLLVNGKPIADCFDKDGNVKKSTVLRGRKGDYGWECRSLFGAPKIAGQQWWMMGCDLSGVELRCFGHHLAEFDGGAYLDIVLNGDVHTTNQKAAELPSRDMAKTFIYACVQMEAMALTKRGWKHYDDLNVGELVLTYNIEKDVQEWKPILEKVKYENADAVRVVNRKGQGSYEVICTPNHRWPVYRTTTVNGVRTRVREFRQTQELNEAMSIIGNAPLNESHEVSPFTGLDTKHGATCQDILNMSSPERSAYLAGFMIADGHYRNNRWHWSQNRGEHAEMALLCSYLAHDGMVGAHTTTEGKNPQLKGALSDSRTWGCQKLTIEPVENQDVWCIRTENESFVVRIGDFITQTGNTLYGAGDEKIGSIVCPPNTPVGMMKARGRELKAKFQEGVPAYRQLVRKIAREGKRGYLTGLDGRKLWIKSMHSALNLLLQSDGALLAKKWVILFHEYMQDAGYRLGWDGDYVQCAWVHDEIQVACRTPEIAKHAAELAVKAAADAGKSFNYRSPIEAQAKIGLTWAETH